MQTPSWIGRDTVTTQPSLRSSRYIIRTSRSLRLWNSKHLRTWTRAPSKTLSLSWSMTILPNELCLSLSTLSMGGSSMLGSLLVVLNSSSLRSMKVEIEDTSRKWWQSTRVSTAAPLVLQPTLTSMETCWFKINQAETIRPHPWLKSILQPITLLGIRL